MCSPSPRDFRIAHLLSPTQPPPHSIPGLQASQAKMVRWRMVSQRRAGDSSAYHAQVGQYSRLISRSKEMRSVRRFKREQSAMTG